MIGAAKRASGAALTYLKEKFGSGEKAGMVYVVIALDAVTNEVSVDSYGPDVVIVNLVSQVAGGFIESGNPGNIVARDAGDAPAKSEEN